MANTSISNLAAGAAVSATDVLPNVQTAGVGPVKTTAAQLRTYALSTTAGTNGGITFSNGSTLTQNVTAGQQLFWDNTNFRIGVGTASPQNALSLSSAGPGITFTRTDQTADNRNWDFFPGASGTFLMRAVNDAYSVAANFFYVARTGTTINTVAFPSGNVGVGTVSPNNNLDIFTGTGTTNIRVGTTAANGYYDFGRDSADGLWNINGAQTTAVGYKFKINGTEVARINNIGYLGIGVTPTSFLHVNGPGAFKAPSTQTGNYSMVAADHSIIFNGSGTITLTLQAASSYVGRMLYVKTIAAQEVNSASSNVVPLIGGAAGTAILTNTAGKWAILQSDGTSWIIMAAN